LDDAAPAPTTVGPDLDHATRRLLAELRARDLVPGDYRSPRYLQLLDEALLELNGAGPPMHAVHEVGDGHDPIRLLQPIEAPIGTVVLFCGGWAPGATRHLDPVLRKLAERTSCAFAAVDAGPIWSAPPEARAARARAAFRAAVAAASGFVHAAAPVVVGGEGPGAWCSTVVAAGDGDGGPQPELQVLLCPLLDGESAADAAGGSLTLSARAVRERWSDGRPTSSLWDLPLPPRASSTLVLTAEHDVLGPQGARYAARLRDAGLAVTHHDFPRQLHGFVGMLSLPLGEAAFQRIIRAVRRLAIPRMPSAASTRGGHVGD
jgi:acetyl esterase